MTSQTTDNQMLLTVRQGSIVSRLVAGLAVVVTLLWIKGSLASGMAFFALFWGLLMISGWLNVMIGRQTISIKGDDLIVTRTIGPVTIGTPKVFKLDKISNLKIEEKRDKMKGGEFVRYEIVFSNGNERGVLLDLMPKTEAENALQTLQKRLN